MRIVHGGRCSGLSAAMEEAGQPMVLMLQVRVTILSVSLLSCFMCSCEECGGGAVSKTASPAKGALPM